MKSTPVDDLMILQKILALLKPLEPAVQVRVVQTAITFLELPLFETQQVSQLAQSASSVFQAQPFSQDRTVAAKEFLVQKKPLTDVERVTCLAYYLTHYKSMPKFKTVDISVLNTEAAQLKFSNVSWTTGNAIKQACRRFLYQLSGRGRLFYLEMLA